MTGEKMTLRQLRYLLALERTGSFHRAADQCAISQPSMTAQMQKLEKLLQVQLLERSRTGIVFTPVGREVAQRAREVLDNVQGIIDLTAGAQHGLAGTIRLGVKPTLGPYLLPNVVARLHTKNPDLNLYVRESAPQELERELINGVHDVILAQLPAFSTELHTERLFREPIYLALPADHKLAEKETVSTKDLRGLRVLSLSPQYHLHSQIRDLCTDYGAKLLRDFEGTSLDTLRQMVGMGMGATFLPALYVASEVPSRSEITIKPFSNRAITRSIGLVWRKSSGREPAFKEISALIRQVATTTFKMLIVEGK